MEFQWVYPGRSQTLRTSDLPKNLGKTWDLGKSLDLGRAAVDSRMNRGSFSLEFPGIPSPYLTFSCQGSLRATADGSSGSLRKDVGV